MARLLSSSQPPVQRNSRIATSDIRRQSVWVHIVLLLMIMFVLQVKDDWMKLGVSSLPHDDNLQLVSTWSWLEHQISKCKLILCCLDVNFCSFRFQKNRPPLASLLLEQMNARSAFESEVWVFCPFSRPPSYPFAVLVPITSLSLPNPYQSPTNSFFSTHKPAPFTLYHSFCSDSISTPAHLPTHTGTKALSVPPAHTFTIPILLIFICFFPIVCQFSYHLVRTS